MLLALGLRENGLPSVITDRTASGHREREVARVHAAEAPADDGDFLAGLLVDRAQAVAQLRAHPRDAAEVAAQLPAVRVVAERREEAAQQARRDVADEEARQHEDGVPVAARRGHEQRRRREGEADLPERAVLREPQQLRRRTEPSVAWRGRAREVPASCRHAKSTVLIIRFVPRGPCCEPQFALACIRQASGLVLFSPTNVS